MVVDAKCEHIFVLNSQLKCTEDYFIVVSTMFPTGFVSHSDFLRTNRHMHTGSRRSSSMSVAYMWSVHLAFLCVCVCATPQAGCKLYVVYQVHSDNRRNENCNENPKLLLSTVGTTMAMKCSVLVYVRLFAVCSIIRFTVSCSLFCSNKKKRQKIEIPKQTGPTFSRRRNLFSTTRSLSSPCRRRVATEIFFFYSVL